MWTCVALILFENFQETPCSSWTTTNTQWTTYQRLSSSRVSGILTTNKNSLEPHCGHRPALTSVQSHWSLVYENRSNSRLLTTNPTQASFWYRSWQQWSFLIDFHTLAIICDPKRSSQLPSEKSCLLATLSVSVCPALLRLIEVMWTTASLKLAMCHTKFGSGYISPIFGARARVDG